MQAGSRLDVRDNTDQSNSMLQIACQDGHERIADLLIKYGADHSYRNNKGYTAEDLALENGHVRIAQYLKEISRKKHAKLFCEGPLQIAKMMQIRNHHQQIKQKNDSINSVLEELQLEKYKGNFENVTYDKFKELTDGDLKDLGISLLGPRRKLTQAIERLHGQNNLD